MFSLVVSSNVDLQATVHCSIGYYHHSEQVAYAAASAALLCVVLVVTENGVLVATPILPVVATSLYAVISNTTFPEE